MKKKNLLSAQATTYGGTLILQQILEILSVIQQAVDGIDYHDKSLAILVCA